MRGRTADTIPVGSIGVVQDGEHVSSLESQTVAAHRAYVEALAAWEKVVHMASCPICRPEGLTDKDHERRCDSAELEKERRRIAFRDLCDELGYVPEGHGIGLRTSTCPTESCVRGGSDDA